MFDLELQTVRQWGNVGNFWCPISIGVPCPYCSERVVFTTSDHQTIGRQKSIACIAVCPACKEVAFFWIVNPGPANDKSQQNCKALVMYPKPIRKREPIEGSSHLPVRIRRAYEDTIKVYNAGVWSATATCCRRTLEGIVNELLPASKNRSLAASLRELRTAEDLKEPIVNLSDTLREGGNLGAHFDLQSDPDKDVAEAMMDLLDYLLEYIYTLPRLTGELRDRLNPPLG